jgi:hypothetical protein
MLRVVTYLHSRRQLILSAGLLWAASLWGATAVAQMTPASEHAVVMPMRGAAPSAARPNNPANMTYQGGPVFPHPTVYAMWWGNPADFPPDTHDGINHWFRVLNDTAYLALANQYMFGKEASVQFGGNLYDYSPPPTLDVPSTDIVAEVASVLKANGMKIDPHALYTVFTSNFPNEQYYCAYHDYVPAPDGTMVHVMYIPNSNNQPLCWVQPPELSCNTRSNGLQAAANATAHELMESMTDPDIDAWYNLTLGIEVGDPCSFTYKRCVYLNDGSRWQLQMIWSNKAGACRQGSGVVEDD